MNCATRRRQSGTTADSTTSVEGGSEDDAAASFVWERSLLTWVGASLVGAMKASGKEEWTREAWEAAASLGTAAIDSGDWTRRGW